MLSSRILTALVVPVLLVACSGADEATETARADQEASDPPGVAQALSLAGRIDEDGDSSDYDRPIGCAAALRITATALAPLTSGTDSREVRMINAAADEFARRARSADGREGRTVSADIERRMAENAEDSGGQAQRAIACANTLE